MKQLISIVILASLASSPAFSRGHERDEWRTHRRKIEAQRWKVEEIARKLHSSGVTGANRVEWSLQLRQENEALKTLIAAQAKPKKHGFRGEHHATNGPASD